jgi:transposase-like protein
MSTLTTQPAVDLLKLMEDFDTDSECRDYLAEIRWPKGVQCPRCQGTKVSRIKARKVFECDCSYQFSVTAGTLFHDSHLPLPKWFLAIFLITESRKGMSALQLKRLLKVSYKTAWYLCHRIREAMIEESPEPLAGTVEIDETYIGGKWRGRPKSDDGREDWRERKTMVVGAVERGGKVRLKSHKAKWHKAGAVAEFIRANIADNCDRIYTDESTYYKHLKPTGKHDTVEHQANEYVRGDVHTNTVESAFGLFKRALVGSYHQVSVKHLDRYLDEFEFRYNNRKNAYLFRDTLIRLMGKGALPYEKLTA